MLSGEKKLSSGWPGLAVADAVAEGIQERPWLFSVNLRRAWRRCSRAEMESDAADQERIARYRKASCSCAIAHGGDVADPKHQAAHDLAGAVDKAEVAIGQRQLRLAGFALADGNSDDLAPVFGKGPRLRALHLHADQGLCHIVADRFLPVRAGRRIGAENIVAALGVVEFDERGAAIARMQLHAVIGRMIDDVGDADADLLGLLAALVRIVAAEDRHVAAAAAGLVEEASGR